MSGFSVSGPDLDRSAKSLGVGLSLATTYASRSTVETSYYVRDGDGQVVGRVDSDGKGRVETYRIDRASGGSGAAPAPPDGRPLRRPATTKKKEESMAQPTRRRASAKQPAAEEGKTDELVAVLMAAVKEKVPDVKQVANPSQTSTRLLTGDDATFAVIFPPSRKGVLVKIPKQLLGVERDLPKDHGFRRGSYGLTRTMVKASEAPKIAAALAVSASATAPATEGAS